MKRLVIYVLVLVAAWQAYKLYPALVHRAPSHNAVVRNQTDRTMERVRLTVGGQTFVKERLASGESAAFSFRVAHDAAFALDWGWADAPAVAHWTGGRVPEGPLVQRHLITVVGEGGVIYTAENKPR